MVNGTTLVLRSIVRSGAIGGHRITGAELAEVGGFAENDKGRFSEKVLYCCIQEEDVETFPKNAFKAVEA